MDFVINQLATGVTLFKSLEDTADQELDNLIKNLETGKEDNEEEEVEEEEEEEDAEDVEEGEEDEDEEERDG